MVTAPTVHVLLFPVHSKRLLSYGVLPEHVSNTTYSDVSKFAKVITVKVVSDDGRVSYPSPRSLPA